MSSPGLWVVIALLLSACEPVKAASEDDGSPGNADGSPDAPLALENCFDGLDDDDSGAADCADPTCGGEAICVAVPDTGEAGIVVGADEACPPGFDGGGATLLYRGLQADACEGCSCTPGATTCKSLVFWYPDEAACAEDTGLTGGTLYSEAVTETCTANPITSGNTYGTRAEIAPTSTCNEAGTAMPPDARWTETRKFCRASTIGVGCAAGSACVPRRAAPSQCVLAAGTAACTGFATTETDWATDFADTRACGACACTASGGGCGNVKIGVGSDYVCTDGVQLTNAQKTCGYIYSPPVRLLGAPTAPTACTASAPQTGTLAPAGPQTLCCGT